VIERRAFRLTPEAESDYFEILATTLAEWGLDQLLIVESEINSIFANLRIYPELGHLREDLLPGVRALVLPPHVVYYVTSENETLIVRILHHRRNARRILKRHRQSPT